MLERGSWQQRWPADLLVLVAGAVLPLAFAPFGWWPLALLALAVLVSLTLHAGTGRSLWRGYLFGLGWFGVGVSWVYVSIRLFGNATTGLSIAITGLLILVLSLYPVLIIWLVRRLSAGGQRTGLLLVFPAAFTLVEWLRGWLFTGFSWLEPGYAFIDTPLALLAPLTGVMGMTFVVVLTAGLLVMVLGREFRTGDRLFGLALIAMIWGTCLLVDLPHYSRPSGEPLKVALMQGNIPQHRKWLPEERTPTLAMYRAMTEQHWDRDIIVWPETAVPAFEDQVTDYINAMHYASQLSSTTLMTGIVTRESHGERYYNALIALGNADRGAESVYAKQHLVPFGEYLPLKALLDPLLDFLEIPMSDFSAGDRKKPVIAAGRYMAGASICFEAAFGEDIRTALPEAHYLVNISNDAWFGDSLAPHQHLQKARMRALETGRYLLRSTNTGISAIIEPDGRVQAMSRQFEREILTGSIQPMQGSTPFVRLGYWPVLGISFLILLGSGWLRRKRPH